MDSLDEFMQTNELAELLKQRKINNSSILNYQSVIKKLKRDNREIEKRLWKTCKHVWGQKDSYDDFVIDNVKYVVFIIIIIFIPNCNTNDMVFYLYGKSNKIVYIYK